MWDFLADKSQLLMLFSDSNISLTQYSLPSLLRWIVLDESNRREESETGAHDWARLPLSIITNHSISAYVSHSPTVLLRL